jgi:hypothetical protein
MEVVLIWILSAVGAGFLAKKKNRNVAGWVIASLFFGIFTLIVLALLKPQNGGSSPRPSGPFPTNYGAPAVPQQGQYGSPGDGQTGPYGAPPPPPRP